MTTTPAVQPPILRYFSYEHLPEGLPRATSILCSAVANTVADNLPGGPELSAGLRHLLEAKDCFVRAALDAPKPEAQVEVEAAPAPAAIEAAEEKDWLAGSTCNTDAPEDCESCQ